MISNAIDAWRESLSLAAGLGASACGSTQPKPGTVQDEAMRANRTAQSFPAADEDYFHDMDGGLSFTPDEIKGRNMWIVWTGGNDELWDMLATESLGSLDFLKTVSSHPDSSGHARQPLARARTGQRTVLQKADRTRSEPLRTVARCA